MHIRRFVLSLAGIYVALQCATCAVASPLERLFVSKPEPLTFFTPQTSSPGKAPATVDHRAWQSWLDRYLVANHPSGIHRVRYAAVDGPGKALLGSYLQSLQAIDPRRLPRDEQLAYWINLYNAATVQVIVNHPGVKSIREIKSGLFSIGPWKLPLVHVAGQTLSLDDIEHRIVRPLFHDRRVHFALNCASLGCPDLAATAYQGATLDAALSAAQLAYLSHSRAIHFTPEGLTISSLFNWYREDFASDEAGMVKYLAAHAPAPLATRLQSFHGTVRYDYDWNLNSAP